MLRMVLKDFPFSRDGLKIEEALKGAVVDIPDALVDGLTTEGYLALENGTALAIPPPPAVQRGGSDGSDAETSGAGSDIGRGAVENAENAKGAALSTITIPADFETRHQLSIMALAKKISGEQPGNKAAAIDVIKAELARRGA